MYFSSSTNGFYVPEIHGENIPSDAVEITEQQHSALMAAQSEGKQIAPDNDGKPVAVEPIPIPLTWEDIRNTRNAKLASCDWTQIADAPLTEDQKQDWVLYRQHLRDVPEIFDSTESVVWPQPPQ